MSTNEKIKRQGGFTGFLIAACTALAVLVVLLTWQNLSLKADLAEAAAGPREEALQSGDAFGSLVLMNESGDATPYVFGGDGQRTLLLVFTQDCPACQKTLPLWNGMLAEAAPPDVRVVGLQLDGDSGPGSWPALTFEVYGVDYAGSESLNKIPYIPATLLLDGNGVVERAWYGMLTDETEQELRRSLAEG